jgi:pilus assembly protein Flp/PilA
MTALLMRLLNEEDGTTAIEYSLIAAGIALAVIVAVNTLGVTVLTTKFQAVANAMAP